MFETDTTSVVKIHITPEEATDPNLSSKLLPRIAKKYKKDLPEGYRYFIERVAIYHDLTTSKPDQYLAMITLGQISDGIYTALEGRLQKMREAIDTGAYIEV